jgi:hypothetical protein
MIQLVTRSALLARSQSSKRVTATHLKTALMNDGQFDFLTEICENAPDEGAGGAKKGRAKSEAKSEDSDEDVKPKKKGGRKRKASSEEDSD